jgi:hypothetical protein
VSTCNQSNSRQDDRQAHNQSTDLPLDGCNYHCILMAADFNSCKGSLIDATLLLSIKLAPGSRCNTVHNLFGNLNRILTSDDSLFDQVVTSSLIV